MNLTITNKTATEAEITIDDVIGWDASSWPGIKKQLAQIADSKISKIVVNIMSPGGMVSDGLVIHDALKMSKANIETRVFGLTASAATVIAQSGDKRKMSANSLYLIHHAMCGVVGNVNDIRTAVEDLEKVDAMMADIYIKKGADADKVRSLMDENNGYGKWIDATEALEAGLIDEIMEPSKAAAIVPSAEILAKYNLPQIPEEYLNKINTDMTEKVEGKKSLLDKVVDLFKGEEEVEKVEEVAAEPAEDITPEAEVKAEEGADGTDAEIATAKDTEMDDLKAKLDEKDAAIAAVNVELANVRSDLQAAYTKLSQLDAASTVVAGGAEGKLDGEADQEVPFGAEIKKITAQINKVPPRRATKDPEKD